MKIYAYDIFEEYERLIEECEKCYLSNKDCLRDWNTKCDTMDMLDELGEIIDK